ncbi:FAD-containing oxidoreductase [Asticcacaulis machinosus]|uniref:FAD-containing oxidoreductase n=1 Tax=Asticcacaulis machinosus TaxID=2984211 RepID=A0ABT5HM33_9CAUL|nr:FAD-containing oxidoreductase [Asticcacaulis machinosus]
MAEFPGAEFDAIIIGAGQAGPSLAGRLTQAGQKVAIIERKLFGGTCVNTGCMPTKALVASAYAAHLARRGGDYGISVGNVSVDMKVVAARARKVTLDARGNVEGWLKGMDGCTVFEGHARFTGPKTISINGQDISAPKIFLNVGGRAAIPDIPGLDGVEYLTNTSIVTLDHLPDHLIVIGGSYIALEFAQMYRRFGAQVTVIERGTRLIAREDADVSEAVRDILAGEGITVHTGIEDLAVAQTGGVISVTFGGQTVRGSHLLVATGRRPNTDDLGLEAAGVKTDARGYITVDDGLKTSVDGIWAMGDCNGRGAFTHTAYNDFEIIAANLLDGASRKVSDRILGYALYIDPPLGRVGMTVAEAEKTGRPLLVSTRPMTRVGRAIEKGETKGFMKVVADADTKKILGAAILGTGGDEAIHGILDMMNAGATVDQLQWAVPIHPTVSELIPTLLGDLKPF